VAADAPAAPTLTAVVTGHDVEGYLRPCLTSLLEGAPADLEVVVVDDASTDGTLWVAEQVASRDARVRVVPLEERHGPARARQRGVEEAHGDHVLFVDGEATLTRGAVTHVLTHLRDHPADLVVFDHARVTWDGKRHRDGRRRDLAALHEHGPVTATGHPELLARRPVVWDRVYRRTLLERLRPLAPADEVTFAHASLLTADTIGVIDRVLYLERTPWRGRGPRPPAPTAVVAAYATSAEWLDTASAPDGWRRLVAQRALSDLVDASRAAPEPAAAADAVARSAALLARLAPAAPPSPAATADAELAATVLAGDRDGYRRHVDERVAATSPRPGRRDRWRRRLRGPLGKLRRQVLAWAADPRARAELAWYALHRRRPVDPQLAVFAAYWFRSYACNPRAVYEQLRRDAPHVRAVWVVEDRVAGGVPDGVVTVRPGSLRYFAVLARARWLVNNVNLPGHYVKRRGTTFLQTHHGTPLKKMGLDTLHHGGAVRKPAYYRRAIERSEAWDLVLSSNRHSTEVWRRAFPVAADIIEYGYPRNDALVRASAADRTAARRRLGIDDDRRVVLFAPTFRDRGRPFDPRFDLGAFLDALTGDTTLLLRSHYFLANTVDAGGDPRVIDVSGVPDANPLCLAADVLVTDYSSIAVDFALLDRPIVLYVPDLDSYARDRGLYLDLTVDRPGPIARTADELVSAVNEAHLPEHREAAARFRRRLGELDDGRAAERVVSRVFLDR
jgi:CDP-glycerol glycerophosphotransferase